MAYERLVGLQVMNDGLYQSYRDAMTPILKRYGGGFRYDFKIQEVLQSEAAHPINRVFLMAFNNLESKNGFFNDPEYKAVRQKFFDPSVSKSTVIAEYDR
jgi:uncharacterized protein (DUF1330 family)